MFLNMLIHKENMYVDKQADNVLVFPQLVQMKFYCLLFIACSYMYVSLANNSAIFGNI